MKRYDVVVLLCILRLINFITQDDAKPKRSRRSRRVKTVDNSAAITRTSTPVITPEEFPASSEHRFDQVDAANKKKFTPANAVWSEDDKGMYLTEALQLNPCPTDFLAQLISLLGRYGDDFKRIAASMPSKVRHRPHVQLFVAYPITRRRHKLVHSTEPTLHR